MSEAIRRSTPEKLPRGDPDRALVRSCQIDRDQHFPALYERYRERVYNVCFRVTGNRAEALDAAQDTFVAIYRSVGRFRFHSRFRSWVYRVALHSSLDRHRSKRARPMVLVPFRREEDDVLFELPDSRPGPLSVLDHGDRESRVQQAITALPDRFKEIVVLRYLEHCSYEELSETLDIPIGTVKSRMSRAHEALRQLLAPAFKER